MAKGADGESINRKIYDVNSPSRMKLLGVALSNLYILPEYRAAFITLSQQELDDNHFQKGDTEGFVNYALSLDNVVFAQIFIEKQDEQIIKTSLRSKGDFDVNKWLASTSMVVVIEMPRVAGQSWICPRPKIN